MKELTAAWLILIFWVSIFGQVGWPTAEGVYVAKSSAGIPAFPRTLSGFRAARTGRDFWGNVFDSRGSIRIGDHWTGIPDFPNTQNKCSHGVFMIRWRTGYGVRIRTTLAYSEENASGGKTASFGYMYGHNCEQPLFRVIDSTNDGTSTVADVCYELKFWQAAP
jgi:hypothetical protein